MRLRAKIWSATALWLAAGCLLPEESRTEFTPSGGGQVGNEYSGGTRATAMSNAAGGVQTTSGSTSCVGAAYAGICWYLGPPGNNCTVNCATHGGVSPGAKLSIGAAIQGGSQLACAQILGLLGIAGTVMITSSQFGLGCLLYTSTSPEDLPSGAYWIADAGYDAAASLPTAQRVCGCLQ